MEALTHASESHGWHTMHGNVRVSRGIPKVHGMILRRIRPTLQWRCPDAGDPRTTWCQWGKLLEWVLTKREAVYTAGNRVGYSVSKSFVTWWFLSGALNSRYKRSGLYISQLGFIVAFFWSFLTTSPIFFQRSGIDVMYHYTWEICNPFLCIEVHR